MISFFNVVYPLCALLGFATCAYKVRDLRRDPTNPALIALTLARAFPALSFTFATPAVYVAVDRLVGIPNLATLIVYLCIVANSVTAQALLLLWSRPAEEVTKAVRTRIAIFSATTAAMMVLFFIADRSGEHPIDFDVQFARHAPIAAFLAIYLVAFSTGLVLSARMTWRFSSVVPQPWMRRGLRLNALGAAFGIGYTVTKAVSIIGRWTGTDVLDTVNILWAPVSACIGAVLIAVSSSLPAWAPDVASRYHRWLWYRRLETLWLAARETNPAVILSPTLRRLDRWNLVGLDDRLYRRVIEIRDVLLSARADFSETAATAAKAQAEADGLPPRYIEAATEAARIAPALTMPRRSRERQGKHLTPTAAPANATASSDLDAEAEWLSRVSYALAHSPHVRRTGTPVEAKR